MWWMDRNLFVRKIDLLEFMKIFIFLKFVVLWFCCFIFWLYCFCFYFYVLIFRILFFILYLRFIVDFVWFVFVGYLVVYLGVLIEDYVEKWWVLLCSLWSRLLLLIMMVVFFVMFFFFYVVYVKYVYGFGVIFVYLCVVDWIFLIVGIVLGDRSWLVNGLFLFVINLYCFGNFVSDLGIVFGVWCVFWVYLVDYFCFRMMRE